MAVTGILKQCAFYGVFKTSDGVNDRLFIVVRIVPEAVNRHYLELRTIEKLLCLCAEYLIVKQDELFSKAQLMQIGYRICDSGIVVTYGRGPFRSTKVTWQWTVRSWSDLIS